MRSTFARAGCAAWWVAAQFGDMRRLRFFSCLLILALGGCGERSREPLVDGGTTVGMNEPCSRSEECPIGFTCIGCSAEDLRCLPGCQTDADCPSGACESLNCITCPCPGACN